MQHLYPLELSCVRETIKNEQRSVGNTENEDSSRTAQGRTLLKKYDQN